MVDQKLRNECGRRIGAVCVVAVFILSAMSILAMNCRAETYWYGFLPEVDTEMNEALSTRCDETGPAEITLSAVIDEVTVPDASQDYYEVRVQTTAHGNVYGFHGYNEVYSDLLVYDLPWYEDLSYGGVIPSNDLQNDGVAVVQLPNYFYFSYYGRLYTEIYVSENGFISLGNHLTSGYSVFQTSYPSASSANGVIAPYWRDFDITLGGQVVYGYAWTPEGGGIDTGAVEIAWDGVYTSDGSCQNFKVTLRESGSELPGMISLSYGDIHKEGDESYSVGLECQYGSRGLTLDQDGVQDTRTIRLPPTQYPWEISSIELFASDSYHDGGAPDYEAELLVTGDYYDSYLGVWKWGGMNADWGLMSNYHVRPFDDSDNCYAADVAGREIDNIPVEDKALSLDGYVVDTYDVPETYYPVECADKYEPVGRTDWAPLSCKVDARNGIDGVSKVWGDLWVAPVLLWRLYDDELYTPGGLQAHLHDLAVYALMTYKHPDGTEHYLSTQTAIQFTFNAERTPEWYGCTIPCSGGTPPFYSYFHEIEYLSLPGGHVDQRDDPDDWGYHMMGVSTDTVVVGYSGGLSVSGWFWMDDTLGSYYQDRRHLRVYVLDEAATNVLAYANILNDDDPIQSWERVDDFVISGLTPDMTVSIGVGRTDLWSDNNFELVAEWAGVEITAPPNPEEPELWSKYDEAAGMTASDSSGNGYTGDLEGVSFSSDGANGNCVYSSGGYANCVDYGNVLGITGDITISCWVKTDSERDYQWLVTKSPDTGYGRTYALALRYDPPTDKYDVDLIRGNPDDASYLVYIRFAGVFSPDGLWHFIAARHDTSTGSFGIRVDDGAWGGDLLAGTGEGPAYDDDSPLQVGNMNSGLGGNYRSLDGYIDDVRIWDEYVPDHVIDDAYIEVEPAIKVLYPNGFEHLERYTTDYIYWDTQGFEPGELVSIILYSWGSQEMVIVTGTANDGVHQWNCDPYANPIGECYQIRIYSYSDPNIEDWSDSYFTIMYVPAAPGNLVGYYVPTGYVHLSWDEPLHDGYHPDGILGYKVYKGQKKGGSIDWDDGTWTVDLYYDDGQVQPNKNYYYYVVAVNEIGESGNYPPIKVQCK